nr:MFS transporter [Candidatus Sigynarchaeum springense]MDO8116696.1 MFS transporter [Candidatus Sigynarchaeota archaeon]
MDDNIASKKRIASIGVILLGIVSLLGDIIYEGARGIIPSYLDYLGASAVLIGLIGGFGDFIGYGLRLISGYLADSTRAYWAFIFIGYGLIAAIPFLAMPLGLEMAILLVLAERVGKAFRSPSRDTVLSFISKDVGTGKAFGFHELLDQVGAIIGPLLVSIFIGFSTGNYSITFGVFSIPFLLLVMVMAYTRKRIDPLIRAVLEKPGSEKRTNRLGKSFYAYALAVLLNTAGLIPASLILFKATKIVEPIGLLWFVPIIYLIIQAIDAPMAMVSGVLYDKYGTKVLVSSFLLSFLPATFAMMTQQLPSLLVAAVIFGIVLGMQESIYRAAVADFAPVPSRGFAYGIFNLVYGSGFVLGGAVFGAFMDWGTPFALSAVYTCIVQSMAIVMLLKSRSSRKSQIEHPA